MGVALDFLELIACLETINLPQARFNLIHLRIYRNAMCFTLSEFVDPINFFYAHYLKKFSTFYCSTFFKKNYNLCSVHYVAVHVTNHNYLFCRSH